MTSGTADLSGVTQARLEAGRTRHSPVQKQEEAMPDTVLYQRDGHVATITYNRPEALNAINAELRADLNAAWTRFRDDDEAWVGIVTGAGRAFSAGADLRWMRRMVDYGEAENIRDAEAMARMFLAIDRCPKPVVARVQGAAMGGAASQTTASHAVSHVSFLCLLCLIRVGGSPGPDIGFSLRSRSAGARPPPSCRAAGPAMPASS